MFKKGLVALMLLCLGVLMYVPFAQAETKIDYGAAFRLRQENWDNLITLNTSNTGSAADRNFFRLRTNLWGKADFSQDLGIYLRLTNEMR